jgi:hypothetical protein
MLPCSWFIPFENESPTPRSTEQQLQPQRALLRSWLGWPWSWSISAIAAKQGVIVRSLTSTRRCLYGLTSSRRHLARYSACLFRLLAASGHQKLLRTAKRSAFQPASIQFIRTKTIQNQHKHIIGWVVVIVGIRHFIDPEPYKQLYLPPHVIVMILRFSSQPDSPHS